MPSNEPGAMAGVGSEVTVLVPPPPPPPVPPPPPPAPPWASAGLVKLAVATRAPNTITSFLLNIVPPPIAARPPMCGRPRLYPCRSVQPTTGPWSYDVWRTPVRQRVGRRG